ncbi:MAG: hypothetical protein KF764_20730 [Labilithrix sp.]|nr:hypothetical protein [Labilithrix sp.]MBX3224617.1 hypothetical protein [Labilithrix sp.]
MRLARRSALLVLGSSLFAGASVSAGCGDDRGSSGPPPIATSSVSDAGARDSGTLVPVETEASRGATTFKGKLATTTAVTFGGTPYCEYSMKLEDIVIEIAALDSGELIGAAVKDRAVEAAAPPCPHAPMAPSQQAFALSTVTPNAAGSTLAFVGAKDNRPETALVIELTRVGVTYQAAAEWRRTDQPAPLDWAVKATLTLAAE